MDTNGKDPKYEYRVFSEEISCGMDPDEDVMHWADDKQQVGWELFQVSALRRIEPNTITIRAQARRLR